MGLTVAVGAKSVSSLPLSREEPQEEVSDDGTVLIPLVTSNAPLVAWATSRNQELKAIVTISSYYKMLPKDSKQKEHILAEMKIQISPSTEPLSLTTYRQAVHRIRLPPSSYSCPSVVADDDKKTHDGITTVSPSVVFSADQRSLSCLIPYPGDDSSAAAAIVVFQLRKPRPFSDSRRDQLPVPSYIHRATSCQRQPSSVPVATNPRLVDDDNTMNNETKRSSLSFSAIQDVCISAKNVESSSSTNNNNNNNRSILLAGCRDGRIVAISYRPVTMAGVLFDPSPPTTATTTTTMQQSSSSSSSDYSSNCCSIQELQHIAEYQQQDENGTTRGKLVAIRANGTAQVFSTHFVLSQEYLYEESNNNHNHKKEAAKNHAAELGGDSEKSLSMHHHAAAAGNLLMGMQELVHVKETGSSSSLFMCAEWISGSHLALMKQQPDDDSHCCKVEIWGISDNATNNGSSALMSTWDMTWDRLLQENHTTYMIDDDDDDDAATNNAQGNMEETDHHQSIMGSMSMEYDEFSDCLAISAVLREKVQAGSSGTSRLRRPFVCIWSWRSNVEGLVVAPAKATPGSMLCKLSFCKDDTGARKLLHMTAPIDSERPRIRAELYNTALLSMAPDNSHRRPRIRQACNLLVGATSVSYPVVRKPSLCDDFEIEWSESKIPSAYHLSRGAPRLAAIGKRAGKSIAIASSHGMCTLDHTMSAKASKQMRMHPRWHLFGNEGEEGSFRALSLSWWEGSPRRGVDKVLSEDILVALIEVEEGKDKGYYLSCWSQRRLDLDNQLLHPVSWSSATGASRWGIRLPRTFVPARVDLLQQPEIDSGISSPRKAVVLLSDDTFATAFRVYQLQLAHKSDDASGSLPYYVRGKCASSCSIASPAELFLASAWFGYDLEHVESSDSPSHPSDTKYVATIAVVRIQGGGIDAVAVSSSSIVAVGQVIETTKDTIWGSDLSAYWEADFVRNRTLNGDSDSLDFFVWMLQLANGALVCWSVPYISSDQELRRLIRPSHPVDWRSDHSTFVHPKSVILGIACPAGKTSLWMQQNVIGTRRIFPMAVVPQSSFGCVLGCGQSCRKLHRSLCEDFEHQIFRPDFLDHEILCPSELFLSLPTFTPSLYSLMLDTISARMNHHHEMEASCVAQHLYSQIRSSPYRESTAMSLQLLVLRMVESIGILRKSQRARQSDQVKMIHVVFATFVDIMRRHTTPLQFATLFLDVGRQIEPSFVRDLFPLPDSPGPDSGDRETVQDLFDLSLECGSISSAVASLPLFEDCCVMRRSCAAIFHRCLHEISDCFEKEYPFVFDVGLEERRTILHIFRYALKLEDSNRETNAQLVLDDDNYSDTSLDVDGSNQRKQYTLFCGISRWFDGRNKEENGVDYAASSFIDHGFEEEITVTMNGSKGMTMMNGTRGIKRRKWFRNEAESVAGVTARYLLTCVFDSELEQKHASWIRAAAIACLLIGDSSTGLPICPKTRFMDMLWMTDFKAIEAFIPDDFDLVKFLVHSIAECDVEIGGEKASMVLDLILVLLALDGACEDLMTETAGLLLIALVVGHCSGRTSDILREDYEEHPLLNAYLDASFEVASRER